MRWSVVLALVLFLEVKRLLLHLHHLLELVLCLYQLISRLVQNRDAMIVQHIHPTMSMGPHSASGFPSLHLHFLPTPNLYRSSWGILTALTCTLQLTSTLRPTS